MTELFASGHAVDVVLAVLALEAFWLKFRGVGWRDIMSTLLAAVLMMIALRSALTGQAWPMIAIPLALSFPAHIYDLRRRKFLRAG